MSRVMRKPAFCICENKDANQLRGNRSADQHLCFHFKSLYFINWKFQASSYLLWLYSLMCVEPGHKPEDRFSRDAACLVKAVNTET